MAEGNFTSDRRLYLDADGAVVEADDESRLTLLVGEGGTLPMDRATALGLVGEDGQPVARAEAEDDGVAGEGEDGEPKPARTAKTAAKRGAKKGSRKA